MYVNFIQPPARDAKRAPHSLSSVVVLCWLHPQRLIAALSLRDGDGIEKAPAFSEEPKLASASLRLIKN